MRSAIGRRNLLVNVYKESNPVTVVNVSNYCFGNVDNCAAGFWMRGCALLECGHFHFPKCLV